MSDSASRVTRWSVRLSGLPRLVKIIVCAAVSLVMVAVTLQVILFVLGPVAFDGSNTMTIGFLLAGAVGIGFYVWGWASLIGFAGVADFQVGRAGVFFVFVGCFFLVIWLAWILLSLIVTSLPPEVPI